ncbi:LOW QUALITY PROTEIN: uncharacterized protein Dana_GF20074, partial [Drosophila ananassae]
MQRLCFCQTNNETICSFVDICIWQRLGVVLASGKSTNCNINSSGNTRNSNNKDEKSLASWLHEEISLECQMRKNLFIFSSNELTERQAG